MELNVSYGGGQQARFAETQARGGAPASVRQKTQADNNTPLPPPPSSSPTQAASADSSAALSLTAAAHKAGEHKATRVVADLHEDIADGFRRTRQFEQADGRRFTRSEETVLTGSGARRTIVQQNPSGSFTRYEEILERNTERPNNFRRIQSFQDASGDTQTRISEDYSVRDPFILSGGTLGRFAGAPLAPFEQSRGNWLDLSA